MDDKLLIDSAVFRTYHELLQIQDEHILLERILSDARSIVNADAGSIYVVEATNLKFCYTQNDSLQRQAPIGKKLIYSTFTIPIDNKSIVGYVAHTGIPLNIPDAYRINNSYHPYTFDKHFDELSGYVTRSVLTVPIKTSLGKIIGVIQLINAMTENNVIRPFTATEESLIGMFADNVALAISRTKMNSSMALKLIKLAELHDPYETAKHAHRVAACATEIYSIWAQKTGLPEKEIQHNRDMLRMAAMLHDVGKILVPSELFKKSTDALSADELKIIHEHTVYGATLFADITSDFDEMVQTIALNHHERWDGSGYPGNITTTDISDLATNIPARQMTFSNKSGENIPILGRIVAIANFFDVLSHRRTYKEPWDENKVIDTIVAESGKRFDPNIVSIFLNNLEIIRSINQNYQEIQDKQ